MTTRIIRNNNNRNNLIVLLDAFRFDPLKNWVGEDEATENNDEDIDPNLIITRKLDRIRSKLNGTDFDDYSYVTVEQQTKLLIKKATSLENICQCFWGWLPVW
eukprot:gnl/Chilomastix_caulleri/6868.p1 GENE.gnl/Chilomastix_caulleri/6868~~gnl/Chilomastix_caulleri/6868.p1  ORF type:complete len:103 (+),score=25.65 gnl/Chilomastix_caulleri/6868:27-335(+)